MSEDKLTFTKQKKTEENLTPPINKSIISKVETNNQEQSQSADSTADD